MKKSIEEPQENLPVLQVIKTASCPTLTGTSELSYHIAADAEEELILKIASNTGAGHYSEEWVAYKDVKTTLPLGTFSAVPLRKLYKNKSLNTPGFLLAVLLKEGVVERAPSKRMLYQTCSDDEFLKTMKCLIPKPSSQPDAPDDVGSSSSSRKTAKTKPPSKTRKS